VFMAGVPVWCGCRTIRPPMTRDTQTRAGPL